MMSSSRKWRSFLQTGKAVCLQHCMQCLVRKFDLFVLILHINDIVHHMGWIVNGHYADGAYEEWYLVF